MKTKPRRSRLLRFLIPILAVFAALGGWAHAADDWVRMHGDFDWNKRDRGKLEVEMLPKGDQTWTIAFHFNFSGDRHVYRGEAKGSLSGPFSGKVQDESGNRTFVFSGKFAGNTFRGTHAELEDGEELYTGNLTLER